jgi:transcriptional regulator with XRE-family HTH domain
MMDKAGITREDLSTEMGYSSDTINRMLDGELIICPSNLEKIASILHTSKHDIIDNMKKLAIDHHMMI